MCAYVYVYIGGGGRGLVYVSMILTITLQEEKSKRIYTGNETAFPERDPTSCTYMYAHVNVKKQLR